MNLHFENTVYSNKRYLNEIDIGMNLFFKHSLRTYILSPILDQNPFCKITNEVVVLK